MTSVDHDPNPHLPRGWECSIDCYHWKTLTSPSTTTWEVNQYVLQSAFYSDDWSSDHDSESDDDFLVGVEENPGPAASPAFYWERQKRSFTWTQTAGLWHTEYISTPINPQLLENGVSRQTFVSDIQLMPLTNHLSALTYISFWSTQAVSLPSGLNENVRMYGKQSRCMSWVNNQQTWISTGQDITVIPESDPWTQGSTPPALYFHLYMASEADHTNQDFMLTNAFSLMSESLNSTGLQDVNVVAMSALTNPIWTTEVNPTAPVISLPAPTPSETCPPVNDVVVRDVSKTPSVYLEREFALLVPERQLVFARESLPVLKRQVACRFAPRIVDWCEVMLRLSLLESSISRGDAANLAARWNRLMHSLNGNISSFFDVGTIPATSTWTLSSAHSVTADRLKVTVTVNISAGALWQLKAGDASLPYFSGSFGSDTLEFEWGPWPTADFVVYLKSDTAGSYAITVASYPQVTQPVSITNTPLPVDVTNSVLTVATAVSVPLLVTGVVEVIGAIANAASPVCVVGPPTPELFRSVDTRVTNVIPIPIGGVVSVPDGVAVTNVVSTTVTNKIDVTAEVTNNVGTYAVEAPPTPGPAQVLSDVSRLLEVWNSGDDESIAAAWNRIMHSLNGNIDTICKGDRFPAVKLEPQPPRTFQSLTFEELATPDPCIQSLQDTPVNSLFDSTRDPRKTDKMWTPVNVPGTDEPELVSPPSKKVGPSEDQIADFMRAKVSQWPMFNRFALLQTADYDWQLEVRALDVPDEQDEEPVEVARNIYAAPVAQKQKGFFIKSGTTPPPQPEPRVKAEPQTADPQSQLKASVRVARQIKDMETLATWFVRRAPRKSFAYAVFKLTSLKADDSPASFVVRAYLAGDLTQAELAAVLLYRANNIPVDTFDNPAFLAWFEDVWACSFPKNRMSQLSSNAVALSNPTERKPDAKVSAGPPTHYDGTAKQPNDNSGHAAALATAWNRLMHALNGNTSNHNRMADIEHYSDWETKILSSSPDGGKVFDPRAAIGKLSGLLSNQPLAGANTLRQNYLRSTKVATDNSTSTASIPNPEAYLYPRQVRSANNAALTTSTQRTQWYEIAEIVRPLRFAHVETALKKSLDEAVARAGWLNPKNTTRTGFRQSDVVTLGDVASPGGDSMMVPFLKLCLLMHTLQWSATNSNALPLGMEMGKFDQINSLAAGYQVILDYNNSSGLNASPFGEGCGGKTSVFPWHALAAQPALYCHVSLTTIPPDQRINAIAVHSILAQLNETGGASAILALIVLMWSSYPSGIWNTLINTTSADHSVFDKTSSIPFSNLLRLPGLPELHLLLPVTPGWKLPTTQAEAQSQLMFDVNFGPTDSTSYTADTPLPICFTGAGGVIAIDMAEYLYTHLAQPATRIDSVTITRFLSALCRLTGRYSDLSCAVSLARIWSVRLPLMAASAPGVVADPPVNSVYQYMHRDFANRFPTIATGDFPTLNPNLHDYILPACLPSWFSQIMVGAYTGTDDGGGKDWQLNVGGPYELQWCMYEFRTFGLGAQALMRSLHVPVSVWNQILDNTTFVFLRETLQDLFVKYDVLGDSTTPEAPRSDAWRAAIVAATGRSVPLSSFGECVFDWMCLPPGGFAGILYDSDALIQGTIPMLYADIWFEVARSKDILPSVETCLVPPPLKKLCGLPDPSLKVVNVTGGMGIPVNEVEQYRAVGVEEDAPFCRNTLWNQRIVWHCSEAFTARVAFTDGTVLAPGEVPDSGQLVCPRTGIPDYTITNLLVNTVACANTCWFASMTDAGRRLILIVPPASQDSMTQVIAGALLTRMETWMYNGVGTLPSTMTGGGRATDKFAKFRRKGGPASEEVKEP